MTGLGAAAACMFSLKEKRDIKKEEVRRQQMTLDYPEILSRLIIFLGAGMSIRTAWDKIAFEYQDMVASGRRTPRHVYRKCMRPAARSGAVSEEGVCGIWQTVRPAVLYCSADFGAEQEEWFKEPEDTLKLEMAEAFGAEKTPGKKTGGGGRNQAVAAAVHAVICCNDHDRGARINGIWVGHMGMRTVHRRREVSVWNLESS